jgi:hypothetical protein
MNRPTNWRRRQLGGGGGSSSLVAVMAVAAWKWRQHRGGGGGSLAAVAVAAAWWRQRQGRGGLVMVGLSMDAFIDAQVDVLLAGHISLQIPTQVGDVNSHNQNKSW